MERSGVPSDVQDNIDEELTEDWDFSGDEQATVRTLVLPNLHPLDGEVYRQRVEEYATRLHREETPQAIAEDLTDLVEEAEFRAEHYDYNGALNLYALVVDERLQERTSALTPILDEALDAAMPAMENFLGEASSNAMLDPVPAESSPLGASTIRHRWLERLFALWMKRLGTRYTEEDLPEIMLSMAWSEDILLLRDPAQCELQKQVHTESPNILEFTGHYRARALEKFLRELPCA